MLWKFLFVVLFVGAIVPAIADECPAGYTYYENVHDDYEHFSSRYTQLEYIESTGTQWIDTEVTGGQWECLAQSVADVNYTHSQVLFVNNFGNSGWTGTDGKIYDFGDTVYSINDKYLYNFSRYVTDSKLFIGNTVTFPYFGRVWYLKIKKLNTLVRDFIPAKRNIDNAVGMYDIVTQRFFENAGESEFIAGPEVGYSIAETDNARCVACSYNTYKPNAGNDACAACPAGTFSPIGSTALSDCAKILNVGDYVVYMPLGKRTEHGLCVMMDGKKYCADLYEKE